MTGRLLPRFVPLLLASALAGACAGELVRTGTPGEARRRLAELWIAPDVEKRDLYHGPGGRALQPREGAAFTIVGYDTTGYSSGFDVEDARGREWDIKVGDEAQAEVVTSRVLWALGYHQPPTYFLSNYTLEGRGGEDPRSGRFRYGDGHKNAGTWSWQENPFVGTRQFAGLVVANVILNNWDLKATNNRIYEVKGDRPARRYVVQDIGASLGLTRFYSFGTRNNVDDFETQRFVVGFRDGRIEFDYHGGDRALLDSLTREDVVWACRLLARIQTGQWRDAFRAAQYPQDVAARFIAKINSKIQEGLALADDGRRP